MPFGNESAWDAQAIVDMEIKAERVTNAFRQRVRLGRQLVYNLGRKYYESPMPFGNESTWDVHY